MITGPYAKLLIGIVIVAGAMPRVETQAQAKRPASTVQQLMQAILFPNANLIFSAQTDDPANVPRDARPSTSTNPLAGLYGGWQAVENSSLALMESADLLNLSGRACASGAAVPIDESQWKAEVEALREAARATLRSGPRAQSAADQRGLRSAGRVLQQLPQDLSPGTESLRL